jgi:hypothetical protein
MKTRKISISEACGFVGVSEETLLRFIETGYFPGSSVAKGIDVAELEGIFGVRIPSQFIKGSESQVSSESLGAPSEVVNGASADEPPTAAASSTVVEGSVEGRASGSRSEADSSGEQTSSASETESRSEPFSSVPRRSLIEMYERLVAQLETELKALKSERDWLKTRIERYEEKSSRDQLLMLAETQTIRSLIADRSERSGSPLRSALEWLGLVPASLPSPATGNPNETTSADKTSAAANK